MAIVCGLEKTLSVRVDDLCHIGVLVVVGDCHAHRGFGLRRCH